MAGDDRDTSYLGNSDLDMKGLWVTMDLLEDHLERKIDMKIDSLAKKMKHMFADHLKGESTFYTPHLDQNRFFPR